MAETYPVLERIMQAIATTLGELVTEGHAAEVVRPTTYALETTLKHSDIVLSHDAPIEAPEQTHDLKEWLVEVRVWCCAKMDDDDATPIQQYLDTQAARVQKKLRADPTWGGLALNTEIRGFEHGANGRVDVTVVLADVHYRHNQDDPFSLN